MGVDEGVIVERALRIREPWIGKILSGEKTWEMRPQRTAVRGLIGLIRQGTNLVVGVARLADCLPALTRANYMEYANRHAIPETILDRVLEKNWVYPWVLDGVRPLPQPVQFRQKSGPVKFIRLEPSAIRDIAAQISISRPAAMEKRQRLTSTVGHRHLGTRQAE